MSMRKLILSLIATVALLSPAKASDDVISNIRFGAAITSIFNNQCRPVNGAAFALAVQVLSGMTDDERFRLLRRARALLERSNREVFCGTFEESVSQMEGAR